MKNNIPWRLLISHLKGENEERDERLFQKWAQKEKNASLLQELNILWRDVQEESSSYTPDTSAYWLRLKNKIQEKKEESRGIPVWRFRVAVAAAMVFLVTSLTFSYLYNRTYSDKTFPLLSYSALNGKSKLLLPDSSIVWLNSGTTLEYRANFNENREVSLNGEALFDVTKDEKRPFVVSTSGLKVRVHGTLFNVSSYSTKEEILVTLLRGSVSLQTGIQEVYLHPGEIAKLNKKNMSLGVSPADISFESFWAGESVRFESKSLRYIIPYLEKWYNVKFTLAATIPDNQKYTFTIKDESLEVILRIISRINPIVYEFDEENNVSITDVEPIKQ